jgi:branched-chain amino acid transport system permease protein
VTILSLGLSDLTTVWQLYFGLFFIAVVMFAPGGITGLLMMHRPLIRGGTLGKVLPSYVVALVPTLIMLIGAMIAIESVVHYTMNAMDDPNIKAFGIPFNASSPMTWALALVLVLGGFVVARMTWRRVALAWDEALTAARAKGLAA